MTDDELRERIDISKECAQLYFPIVGALHQKQRAALCAVWLCAYKAEASGDLQEAYCLHHYLYTEYQSLFHEPSWSLRIPDYTKPPIPIDRWVTPDILFEAQRLTSGLVDPPNNAAKVLAMCVPTGELSEMLGDLDEEFERFVQPRFGTKFAKCWYWKQVVVTAARYQLSMPAGRIMGFFQKVIVDVIVNLLRR